MAKVAFRLEADKEPNHVRWVKLLIEIASARELGQDIGVCRGDLAFWVADKSSEGKGDQRFPSHAEEPRIRGVVGQLANDEATNADLLRQVLSAGP